MDTVQEIKALVDAKKGEFLDAADKVWSYAELGFIPEGRYTNEDFLGSKADLSALSQVFIITDFSIVE